jgi:hypothetical protein
MIETTNEIFYYGMFSDEGNAAVHGIVLMAKVSGAGWLEVYQALENLKNADYDKFGEATDTMVREIVYDAMGFTSDFYI